MMTTRDPKLIEAAVARLEGTFGSTPNNPEVIDALAFTRGRHVFERESVVGASDPSPGAAGGPHRDDVIEDIHAGRIERAGRDHGQHDHIARGGGTCLNTERRRGLRRAP